MLKKKWGKQIVLEGNKIVRLEREVEKKQDKNRQQNMER